MRLKRLLTWIDADPNTIANSNFAKPSYSYIDKVKY